MVGGKGICNISSSTQRSSLFFLYMFMYVRCGCEKAVWLVSQQRVDDTIDRGSKKGEEEKNGAVHSTFGLFVTNHFLFTLSSLDSFLNKSVTRSLHAHTLTHTTRTRSRRSVLRFLFRWARKTQGKSRKRGFYLSAWPRLDLVSPYNPEKIKKTRPAFCQT